MSRVLIACSIDKISYKAARNYFENIHEKGDNIRIFHLHTPPVLQFNLQRGNKDAQAAADDIYEEKEEKMQEKLENLKDEFEIPDELFEYCPLDTSDHSSKAEHIAHEILVEASQFKATKIIMGSRKACMDKKFLGSVSNLVGQEGTKKGIKVLVLEE